ncbi:MAG: helix-turn-helix domain-containing protein [Alphaproteobacteria bacterium]|nr:helix-turn-helix domain-containing protein [Alphaproteobacteria bacterium]
MEEKIRTFTRLLRELQKIDQEFPLQYAVCLAEISMEEGISLTQLSQKTGMPLSTVSRIVGALSKHRQKGAPFELIRVKISEQERRRKELHLTAKGKAFIDSIIEIL